MKLSERQQRIVDTLRESEELGVDELAQRFDVSTQTIRKDINQLSEAGLTRRIHGGIALPASGRNISFRSRQATNVSAKRAMARACAELIPDGASVFLGIGTSVALLAEALTERRDLRVLTNNLDVAELLCDYPQISVSLSGGQLRHSDRDLVGGAAVDFIRAHRVDFGVVGAGGLDSEAGLLDFDPREAEVSRTILACARQRILLVDQSKWRRRAMVVVDDFNALDLMVTDALPDDAAAVLAKAGVQVVEAQRPDGKSETESANR
ncbi:DeoR/GlpR family DNA-binding transcription regulator [Marinobacterium mangrovicola]|uniref:DeoR family transcriptional regulator n=1 Tax=Marinobacterium mangrovicola TaxID=1476959 RepID=A0A4R1GMS0_9GAMM|nr:DeoR/GlpR family DNA-binding transcription regulator [Marinobacterium mangrovicola]TCK05712.1 DeoR family transcriptional regulator [Marinobacterium mangrovicola]